MNNKKCKQEINKNEDNQVKKKRKLFSSSDNVVFNEKSLLAKTSFNSVTEYIKVKKKANNIFKYTSHNLNLEKSDKLNNIFIKNENHSSFNSLSNEKKCITLCRNDSIKINLESSPAKLIDRKNSSSKSISKFLLKDKNNYLDLKNCDIPSKINIGTELKHFVKRNNISSNESYSISSNETNTQTKINLKSSFTNKLSMKKNVTKDKNQLDSEYCDNFSKICTKIQVKKNNVKNKNVSINLFVNENKLVMSNKTDTGTKINLKTSPKKLSNIKPVLSTKNFNTKDNGQNSNVLLFSSNLKSSPGKLPTIKSNGKNVKNSKLLNKPYFDQNTFLASLSESVSKSDSHPDSLTYKNNFIETKHELTERLFNLYNSEIFANKIPSNTKVEWSNRMLRSAGFTHNKRAVKLKSGEQIYSSRIKLSTKVVDRPSRLRDVLIHEMCHAVTWIVHNVKDGHGTFWKTWAQKAMLIFPSLPIIERCHSYDIQTKYTYRCIKCGYSFGRHSKSINIEQKCCGRCRGRFEIILNKS